MRVGFIGLGEQGAPIAQRIIAAQYPVTLWARRAQTLAPFAKSGAMLAPDLTALAAASDVVAICLRNDADVCQVLAGPDGLIARMTPGSVVAIHSTIAPHTCRMLASEAERRGVDLVDAPVSGGAAAAREGRLAVMVGGSEAAFERCRPLFAAFGNPVVHMGETGAGQFAKIVNNALYTAHIALVDDAICTGRELGLDVEALMHVLRNGSGRSVTMERYDPSRGVRSYVASLDLLEKDIGIYWRALEERGIGPGTLAYTARTSVVLLTQCAKDLKNRERGGVAPES
ncbi:NAD(P)-dependent oxidoreductase [Paraburkholderia dinghuensis]|uniref:NAD(P)-dependent oxidoreductase n=2 Tax=Paraburkholderia dinghuensis TaxID=2305225 RepID=A0A3N6MMB4_9BURK|nr:NAD(P)-dependent oxidoreductase [Paraburkholderia dinghuensis]RQH04974.1 NAD(P)-dependent oxidoreductase [Paraburkholderia dinghuensis]